MQFFLLLPIILELWFPRNELPNIFCWYLLESSELNLDSPSGSFSRSVDIWLLTTTYVLPSKWVASHCHLWWLFQPCSFQSLRVSVLQWDWKNSSYVSHLPIVLVSFLTLVYFFSNRSWHSCLIFSTFTSIRISFIIIVLIAKLAYAICYAVFRIGFSSFIWNPSLSKNQNLAFICCAVACFTSCMINRPNGRTLNVQISMFHWQCRSLRSLWSMLTAKRASFRSINMSQIPWSQSTDLPLPTFPV